VKRHGLAVPNPASAFQPVVKQVQYYAIYSCARCPRLPVMSRETLRVLLKTQFDSNKILRAPAMFSWRE